MIDKSMQFKSLLFMECIIRFRRSATPVLFLILCGAAFLLMPETGTGGVMFLIGKQRVLLNSAATSLTSAIMGGLVLSLAGFYLISNSVTHDLQSGVGRLIAATPLSSVRYLAGKLAGNIMYLTVVVAIFMIACMGMHVLRGELLLEPIVFLETFGIMFIPLIPCVATISLLFECVPFLSGRSGDVFYFLVWTIFLGLPAALNAASMEHSWIFALDITGLGFFIHEIKMVMGTGNFSIGYAPYNASLPPIFFAGLRWLPELIFLRMASVLLMVPLFGVAWAAFRRFDPARSRSNSKAGIGKIARLRQRLISVLFRVVAPRGGWITGHPTFVKATLLDVRLTLALSPVFFIVIASSILFSLLAPLDMIRDSFLPIIFFVLVPLLASISTRDRVSNTTRLVFSAPFLKQDFALLKFFSAFLSTLLVGLFPLIRICLDDPFSAAALLNGMLFIASAATLLGLLTGTPKTFVVLFLLYLFIAVRSISLPAFDFAGWQRVATPSIILTYAVASVLMVMAAWGFKRFNRLRIDN